MSYLDEICTAKLWAKTKEYADNTAPAAATKDKTGIVKVGDGLNIAEDGTLSAEITKSYFDTSINKLHSEIESLGILMSHQYSFTESGTFVKPAGLTTINVLAIGGKGGDGYANTGMNGRGGQGGTGDVVYKQLTLSEEELSIQITIGANGKTGSKASTARIEGQTDGSAGGDGGSTLFGTYVTAIGGKGGSGGKGGIYNTNYSYRDYAGDGGNGGDGYYGGKGGDSGDSSDYGGDGGNGGNGYYGGNGGNAGSYKAGTVTGGNGGNGIVAGKGGSPDGKDGTSGVNVSVYGQSAQIIPSFVTDLRTPAVYVWW